MARQLRGINHLRVSNGGYSPGAASGAEAEVGAVAVTPPNHLSSPPGAVTPPVTTLPPLPSHRFSHFSDVCRAGHGVIAVNCSRAADKSIDSSTVNSTCDVSAAVGATRLPPDTHTAAALPTCEQAGEA